MPKQKYYVLDVPFNRIHNRELIGKTLNKPPSYTIVILIEKDGVDALEAILALPEYQK